MAPSGEHETNRVSATGDRWRWLGVTAVALVFLAASVRLFSLIDAHAVNVLYWDQYTLFQAFVDDHGLWDWFRWQHGPHRQGIGFWVTAWVAEATDWNARVDAFVVGGAVVVAAGLALALRMRTSGTLHAGDAAIPLLVLTPAQYGIFVHTPNLSHGAGPLLLLLLYCLAFGIEARRRRYACVVFLDFLLIHTGFGIFVGALTPPILVLCAWLDRSDDEGRGWQWPAAGVVLSCAWIGIFLWDYTTVGGLDDINPQGHPVASYAIYAALMFANVLGLKGANWASLGLGGTAALLAFGVAAEQGWRLLRDTPRRAEATAIVVLCGFTLLYVATTAYGRLDYGLPGSQSTRYVPLLVPAFLGLYLRSQACQTRRVRHGFAAVAVVAMLWATIPMRPNEARFMEHLSRGKQRWVETYLETRDVASANDRAQLEVFPHDGPEFPKVLGFMEANRLGFFAKQETPAER
ncbi:MAG: hypothetical protein AAF430_06095 [Myxococcota bacterium]